MTTTQVRAHSRRKPDRTANDPFKGLIEARKAVLAAKFKAREDWPQSGYSLPRLWRNVADAFRSWRG